MATIKCPQCGTENYFRLAQPVYDGPFRCMKYRGTYAIRVEDDELKSCRPLDKEEIDRLNMRRHG